MSVPQFVNSLRQKGVLLELDRDGLKVNAPKGAISPEMREELKNQREHVIAFLQAEKNGILVQAPVDREKPIPASPVQRGLWFQYQLEGLSGTYNIPCFFRLDGFLDIPALEKSLRFLIARHEALRAHFIDLDGEPHMQVEAEVEWSLTRHPYDPQGMEREKAFFAAEPFRLENGPLFRAHLWSDGEQRHALLLVFHHIIMDGWSQNMFEGELSRVYARISAGQEPDLPAKTLDLADITARENAWIESGDYTKKLRDWMNILRGAPEALDLPGDRPRPPVLTFLGERIEFDIPADLGGQLRALARRLDSTLYMVMFAGFAILMSRLTGKRDIVLGTPYANRPRKEMEDILGYFVNTLPLRIDLSGNPTLAELVHRVRLSVMTTHEYQSIPFDRLVTALNPRRDPRYQPLYQVVVAYNRAGSGLRLGDCMASAEIVDIGISKFELSFGINELGGDIFAELQYNAALYTPAYAREMLARYRRILEWMVSDPAGGCDDFDILLAEERGRILNEWNRTGENFPSLCVHERIEAQARATPDDLAVQDATQRLSYRQMNARANQIARRLRAMGAGPDVPVGLYLDRGAGLITAILAIFKAGSPYVPLDIIYPPARRAEILRDAGARILVTHRSLASDLSAPLSILALDTDQALLDAEDETDLPPAAGPESLAYILYTSGTTGKPKGVEISHTSLLNCLLSAAQRTRLSAGDLSLTITTPTFDISAFEFLAPLCIGGAVYVTSREEVFDPALLSRRIAELDLQWMFATPAAWRMLFAAGWQGKTGLKILCGGEAFPPDLAKKLMTSCGEVYNLYGPTEATILCTSIRLLPDSPVTIGRPIANTLIYILDPNLNPVPPGVFGELFIAGAGLARGYHNRPDLSADKFIPDPFYPSARMYRSGDLARFLPDGQIDIAGRIDTQVKIRGFRIELGEIEAALKEYPGVGDALVVAREDQPGNPLLAAYLTGPDKLDFHMLRQSLEKKLPQYMIPAAWAVLPAFPLTPSGKIDHQALPAPAAMVEETGQTETGLEARLASVWAAVLGLPAVSPNADFFTQLGGNSLQAVRLIAAVESETAVRLPVVELFRAPTVRQLARIVQERQTPAAWSPLVPVQPLGTGVPLFIIHSPAAALNLAQELGQEWPIYALEASGLEPGTIQDTSIEQMAERYLQVIRQVQPTGPYRLIGFCTGGMAAYEMARRLSQSGESVSLLVELEAYAPKSLRHSWSHWMAAIGHSAPFWLRRVRKFGFQGSLRRFGRLIEKIRFSRTNTALDQAALEMEFERQRRDITQAYRLRLRQHTEMLGQAQMAYNPRPYRGPVTVFSARWRHLYQILNRPSDPSLGWGQLAQGGLRIYSFDGEHDEFYRPPHVARMAAVLRDILRRLDREQGSL
jgi:amino acid adenylation domain-containing protein